MNNARLHSNAVAAFLEAGAAEIFPRVPAPVELDADLWRILAPGHVPTASEQAYVDQREREGREL